MKKLILLVTIVFAFMSLQACELREKTESSKEALKVERQSAQYAKGQPVPAFNWSLERHLITELYKLRNQKVATHSVWRSDYGIVEGECRSFGYGLPYDVSLTNPLVATDIDQQGEEHSYQGGALASVEQPEPNGIFASKNTSATWVFCVGDSGSLEPVYVESKVTVYPHPVEVDWSSNRVTKAGKATATIKR